MTPWLSSASSASCCARELVGRERAEERGSAQELGARSAVSTKQLVVGAGEGSVAGEEAGTRVLLTTLE